MPIQVPQRSNGSTGSVIAGPGSSIGLMVGAMNPLGWAFTGHLILDPSVGRLALSPARTRPGGILLVGSSLELGRDGAISKAKPGTLPRRSQGHPERTSSSRLTADRARPLHPVSSTKMRCRAVSLL